MALAFYDEFEGTSVDTSIWGFQSSAEALWCDDPVGTGNPDNQQLEFDRPANASVSNGTLKMTAQREAISACGQNYDWTSTLLTTEQSASGGGGYSFRYGWMEASMKFPSIRGFWPAWWTWDVAGTPNNETDAIEYYSDNKSRVYQTAHTPGGGECETAIDTTWGQDGTGSAFDPSAGFHTYAADITPDGVDFYVDGILTCHADGVPTGPTNVILDNFVYSGIPPGASTNQGVTEVAFVRVWT